MKRAIRILEQVIEKINVEMAKTQKAIDEPEMQCDYIFAMADMANFESDVIQITKAIEILNNHYNDIHARRNQKTKSHDAFPGK